MFVWYAAILVVILAAALIIFSDSVKSCIFTTLLKTGSNKAVCHFTQRDTKSLDCRAKLINREEESGVLSDVFVIEICGSIHVQDDVRGAALQVFITDITDGTGKCKPIHSAVERWRLPDSPVFCYKTKLGKISKETATLSNWTAVAKLPCDWLTFPRKGKRNLQFSISIFSHEDGRELVCDVCTIFYENVAFGYFDLQENIQRTRTLGVVLAFAVSAADGRLYDCEVALIKNWAKHNIVFPDASGKARRRLDKALNKAVCFFRKGNQPDVYKICRDIVAISPVAERYDILELCLHVAQAKGVVVTEELAVLEDLAGRLDVDTNKFRSMMEKIIPVAALPTENVKVVLGVNSDMSKEETRQHLNKEYRKWNTRVTSSDSKIQTQADYILRFIAEIRQECAG